MIHFVCINSFDYPLFIILGSETKPTKNMNQINKKLKVIWQAFKREQVMITGE